MCLTIGTHSCILFYHQLPLDEFPVITPRPTPGASDATDDNRDLFTSVEKIENAQQVSRPSLLVLLDYEFYLSYIVLFCF